MPSAQSQRSKEDLGDELRLNLDLWKHEEGLRQQRNTVLLGTNAFLAVAASALINARPPWGIALSTGIALAGFGLLICWIWDRLQQRHVVYADFRRKQIRELAAQLNYESWERQWEALRSPPDQSPVQVEFPHTGAHFSPRQAQGSAILTESLLPRAIAAAWALFALGGVILTLCR
ncbi:MAG TPA: hypothetical protein VIS51_00070 [Solirubrobacterales bacterium]